MSSILWEIPTRLETTRLLLRCPQVGDGPTFRAAISDSLPELRPWFTWAEEAPSSQKCEAQMQAAREKFLNRQQLTWLVVFKPTEALIGCVELADIDWQVPRFDLHFWIRTPYERRGLMREAVASVSGFAFDLLHAERLQMVIDTRNTRAMALARALNFQLEGILHRQKREPYTQHLIDLAVFAKLRVTPASPNRPQ